MSQIVHSVIDNRQIVIIPSPLWALLSVSVHCFWCVQQKIYLKAATLQHNIKLATAPYNPMFNGFEGISLIVMGK